MATLARLRVGGSFGRGVRRTIVPLTVGAPARGLPAARREEHQRADYACAGMNLGERLDAPRPRPRRGSVSGFATSDEGRARRRDARIRVRGEAGVLLVRRSASSPTAPAPAGSQRRRARPPAGERLEAALERGIRPVSDDDAGDAHVQLSVNRECAARRLGPAELLRTREPGGDEPVAVGDCLLGCPAASASGSPGSTRTAASPATSGTAPALLATTGVPEAIDSEHRQAEPS